MKKEKLYVLFSLLCLVLVLLLACTPGTTPTPLPTAKPTPTPTPTSAPSASPSPGPKATATPTTAPVSFGGKTITMVVPFGPGGSYDIMARVYARYLPRYLPGTPTIIVRDVPAGNATVGSNYVYSSKPDGLTLLVSGGAVPINQLLGVKAVHYDLLKMTACVGQKAGGWFVYMRTGIIGKPEDLPKAKGLIFGSGPETAPSALIFLFAKELLNIPTDRVIVAYSGGGDTLRAFLAGEINTSGIANLVYSDSIAPLVAKGEAMLLFQSGLLDPNGDLVKDCSLPPDLLTIKELYEKIYGKSPSGTAWEAIRTVLAGAGNSQLLCLPPGTPDTIVRAYWDASEAMLKDPEFRKVVDPLAGKDTVWEAGKNYDKEFKLNFAVKPEVRSWLRDALTKYGVVVD